uniref:ATP synthase F0 subunit 8 n=1 Tax=Angulomastax meiospina TaxID=3034362 RepID=UPI002410E752|nr:ATP synthase F0 subunit 8 [Angulomastax meiospina]WEL32764.1 ATP synthase F0 subunit 8 [Angulomastax meiospina]
MPQMAPLMWLTLFILFSMLMIMFNIFNYFLLENKVTILALKKDYNKMIYWKW